MSDYLDKAKDLAKDLTGKARDAVTEHSDKIDGGIDKAAEFVDDKTKGKYSDKIDTGTAIPRFITIDFIGNSSSLG